jgi:hypothetical protein
MANWRLSRSANFTTINMPIYIKCAWCDASMGVKESVSDSTSGITHSICADCAVKLYQQSKNASPIQPSWDGVERRRGIDRRNGERRASIRYVANTLVVFNKIAWIDSEKTDRRRTVRRMADCEMLANSILKGSFK